MGREGPKGKRRNMMEIVPQWPCVAAIKKRGAEGNSAASKNPARPPFPSPPYLPLRYGASPSPIQCAPKRRPHHEVFRCQHAHWPTYAIMAPYVRGSIHGIEVLQFVDAPG